MIRSRNLIAVALIIITVITAGCSSISLFAQKPYKETQFLMDTIIEITAYGPNAPTAVKAAFAEFSRIQAISDHFNPNSQLSKINQMAGVAPVAVNADLLSMIQDSLAISRKTDGAFDITIGPLTDLWGIGHKGDFVPSDEEIQKLLPLVNYRLVQVNAAKKTVYLPKKGMLLDLGGVAKDYALNKAIHILKSQGITAALVNAGGDIQTIGVKPDGKPWRIGVQNPRNSEAVSAKVTLDPWNVSQTSGDYQRYFMKNNIRYHHILNPKTGKQPRELASVTLLYKGDDVYSHGDIASSGFMVLGLDKAMEALRKFPGVEAIFVTSDGKLVLSPGLKDKVEL